MFSVCSSRLAWLAALLLSLPPAVAKADLISGSADADGPDGGVTGAILSLVPSGPGTKTIPITGDVMGSAYGEAAAGTTPVTAVATELKPTAGPGAILTAGPPAVGGTVGYPLTTNTHSNLVGSATATTMGLIRGIPTGPGKGVINAVTIVGITPTTAKASGIAFAVATATVKTDPLVLDPLSTAANAMLVVNLLSDYPTDPSAEFSLTAAATGGFAASEFQLSVTTDIPGLGTLFDLSFAANSDSNHVTVGFESPVISDPFVSSDFTSSSPGTYVLSDSMTQFDVPFTIPAGTLAVSSTLGSEGLVLNFDQSSEAIAEAPEPVEFVPLAGVLVVFAFFRVSRRTRRG
jgi:hypothetical protein